uniref:Death domain-containing protein n=1 Tax=Amphimedon queenslandica TaxID=400682 RepID=A0A1X7TEL2_AMPQE
MIDVSQWRASIGLWNYCQAASSRPANGRHSHSFKAAVDSKSGSTTSGEKTSKLPAALSLIALLLLLFLSLSLLRHIFMIPPTSNCYQVQCTTGVTVTDTNSLQSVVLPGGSSSNLIYNDLYLIVCLRMLLLLSGDVELNPGPVTGNPRDILRTHFVKLVDSISIDIPRTAYALYAKELIPQQTKQEMLVPAVDNYIKAAKLMNVIEKQLESSLNPEQYLTDVCLVLISQQHRTLTDIATSILHQLGTLEKWCKEGIMTLTLTRVLMIGPAGSGKTCAQSLLLNEGPPTGIPSEYANSSKSPTLLQSDPHTNAPSTTTTPVQSTGLTPYSIVSKPTTDSTPIACKAVKALRIAFDGKETWKRITRDELLKKLASSLKKAAENALRRRQISAHLHLEELEGAMEIDLEVPLEDYDPEDVLKEIADLLPNACRSSVKLGESIVSKHNPGPITGKELDMAAVIKIFGSSDDNYMTIGAGLNVKTTDLKPIPGTASTNLNLVFQRWFDADRDVSWGRLMKLCDDFPDKLGKAKSNLLAHIGAEKDKKELAETVTRQNNVKKLKVEDEDEEDMPDIN